MRETRERLSERVTWMHESDEQGTELKCSYTACLCLLSALVPSLSLGHRVVASWLRGLMACGEGGLGLAWNSEGKNRGRKFDKFDLCRLPLECCRMAVCGPRPSPLLRPHPPHPVIGALTV